jgi:hypothetical protein
MGGWSKMTSSEDDGSMSVPQEFRDKHGLDDEWEVRFTADELRGREMAKQYRDAGYEVRVLPLQPDNEALDIEDVEEFSEGLDLEHDPLKYVEEDSCTTCLQDTYVVFTKGEPGEADDAPVDDLIYEQ